jgi:predicted DNA-binding transcriptional regulator AlpA
MDSTEQDKVYVTAAQVKRRYGGVSDMTLHRWLKSEKLGFPKPIKINNRRLWDSKHLENFDLKRSA